MKYCVKLGNCLDELKNIPDGSCRCCVTSPPYWGLRQYLFDGAVILDNKLSDEEKEIIEKELEDYGIKPKSS
jgi:DNA modification methylase